MFANPKFVYHGTNEKYLARIREGGLRPRSTTGSSNYADVDGANLESHGEYLYLSASRALLYGVAASGRKRVLLLEIPFDTLDTDMCYPDEDSIVSRMLIAEGSFEGAHHDERFNELISAVHPGGHKGDWKSYFAEFGNLAYSGNISFKKMTRYALIDEPSVKTVLLDVLARRQPSAHNVAELLKFQAASISFIFDGTDIPGVSPEEMRRLRVWRLQSVAVRRVKTK